MNQSIGINLPRKKMI